MERERAHCSISIRIQNSDLVFFFMNKFLFSFSFRSFIFQLTGAHQDILILKS
jgi:hypothetical protein